MTAIDRISCNFRRLDRFALADTAIHRLDARAKVVVTLAFVLTVVSFDRYAVSALLPLFIFPIVLAALGGLPTGYLVKNVAIAIPFALTIALFNPIFDRQVAFELGSLPISGGWISGASIVVRAVLTLSAAVVLVGVTGFPAVCGALERLGMPRLFAAQLQFLYRYIFVLLEDGACSARALSLRCGGRMPRPRTVASLLGLLLLRSWQRAEQVHLAMLARAYGGEFYGRKSGRFGRRELLFVFAWLAVFYLLRSHDVAAVLGSLVVQVRR
ncbi:MAG: cobalt ECF transporter T component CbiQ [Candidatus Accumulibacter sp.]|uniref:cobalt ECF transporter T component CbiQ n=1 Tax=Accumulibacter sp. TaxID=2053492 RepID=UPI001DA679A3|nr:cobalt ECF transporter T component CbiQ [Accumulibacter sp.]MCB1941824.1 cobalt ECF transporter T component CbiQ [Accumulibacter sp.]MCP5249308.1 cobalt ECF transporter T component CbiQ [Accumulibacter sp.]